MHTRTVGLGASLALAANALLLPPGVAIETTDATEVVSTFHTDPNHQVVKLECAGCPYAESKDDEHMAWTEKAENSLIFEVDTGVDRDSLIINGARLFPPVFGAIPEPMVIHQFPNNVETSNFVDEHPQHPGLLVTGYEFRFDAAQTISENGNELLPMTLSILSIARVPIPKQTLRIFIIKDAEGHLAIADINKAEEGEHGMEHPRPDLEMKECYDWPMVCKIKALLESKMGSKKPGCPKMMDRPHGKDGHGPRPPHKHGKPPHTMRPPHEHSDEHQHHRHRHGKMHHLMHVFSRAMFRFLVPVLVGIAAGIATYLVGMVIGMSAALIWLKIRGRGQYERIALDEEDIAGDDVVNSEKAVYLVEEIAEVEGEVPPAYRDADEKELVEADNTRES